MDRQLLLALILCFLGTACARLHSPVPIRERYAPSFLDQQRQRYISLENTLWHVIASGLDQQYVLQQIHSGHNAFLRNPFFEKSSPLSTFDPEQRMLREAIQHINQSLAITLENYLLSHRRSYFNERDLLAVATHNRNLTYYLEKIQEITESGEFYKTIKNVSNISFLFSIRLLSFNGPKDS